MRSPGFRAPLATAAVVVFTDQFAKAVAERHAPVARNPALAFGVVGGSAPALVLVTIAVVVVFVAVVGLLAARLRVPTALPAVVAGGALANALDRVRFGAARDFIALPGVTVNVADIAVAAGVAALAVAFAFRLRVRERRPA